MRLSVVMILLVFTACSRSVDTAAPADTAVAAACAHPVSLLLAGGEPSGFERCDDGAINRTEAVDVDPTPHGEPCAGDEDELYCTTDAECNGTQSACVHREAAGGDTLCACVYTCGRDAECGEGEACVTPDVLEHGDVGPTCVPATCRTNADCPSGECGLTDWDSGCGILTVLACRSEEDRCHGPEDCPVDEDGEAGECVVNSVGGGTYLCRTAQDCTD